MSEIPFGRKSSSTSQRKYPRFRTKPLHNIALQIKGNNPYLRIANISLGGIGIFSEGLDKMAKTIDATLSIGMEKFNIRLEKVFESDAMVGCCFDNAGPELQNCIEKYFQTELMASKLNRVNTIPAVNDGQDKIIYFHGRSNCELLINERNGKISYFSVVVLGNCIEVDPKRGFTAGTQITDPKIPVNDGVFLYKPIGKSGKHLLDIAIRFIDSIEDLPAEYKKNLIQIMNDLSSKAGM